MEIRNDDFDELDDFDEVDGFDEIDEFDDTLTQDTEDFDPLEEEEGQEHTEDVLDSFLRDKGISDKSSIMVENEDGNLVETDWESLSDEEKLDILRFNNVEEPETGLDDSEIALINAIRRSQMTPAEYMNYVQQTGVNNYLSNAQQPHYKVDDISDDDLYMTDVLAKLGAENISSEELAEMLIQAKQNESVYQKQIEVLRNDYRSREQEDLQNQQYYMQQAQVEQFNQFAESVEHEIRNFTELGGYDLNMTEDEMEEVYDFITGFDQAGVSIFGKALNDPQLLVRMAWFALNGDRAMQDINDYWTNEIKNTRRNNQKPQDKVTIKKAQKSSKIDDDLDDW